MCVCVCSAVYTKSLIFRDFDDASKHPLRYVDLFLLLTLLSKRISELFLYDLSHRGQNCGTAAPHWRSGPYKVPLLD